MGRRKTYDRDDVARQAMELFWTHGFQGTSAKMLSDEIGINPFSIFSEFGSKQGLFEAAVSIYLDEVRTIFSRMNAPDVLLQDMRELFRFYEGFNQGAMGGRGCLMTNVATERSPQEPTSQVAVDTYVGILSAGFENCLRRAKKRGELRDDVLVLDEARHFTSTVLGLFVLMRANAKATVIKAAIRSAVRHLDSLIGDDGA